MKSYSNGIAILVSALLLTACGSGSDDVSNSVEPTPQALGPRTITYFSDTGETEAIETFSYPTTGTLRSTLFTSSGPDNQWETADDIASGSTLCRYQDDGFMAPMPAPLFLVGISEVSEGETALENEGIDPHLPDPRRCPTRVLSNLVEETRTCESGDCRERLGPTQSLNITNTLQPGRVLEQQITITPFHDGAHAAYFHFTQTAQFHYNAYGLLQQISENTATSSSLLDGEEDDSLAEIAAQDCPESPSPELDLTTTGPACRGLKRERQLTLNGLEARVSAERYHGLYPHYSENRNRYYDEVTNRVYDLNDGDFPPSPDDNALNVTDFSQPQSIRRYTLTKGTDSLWLTDDDEEQDTYKAELNAQKQPLTITTALDEYRFYYDAEGRPEQIDYFVGEELKRQQRYFFDTSGGVSIEELRYSEEQEALTLHSRVELAMQSSILDFAGDFPFLPKVPKAPTVKSALYGRLLGGQFPSLLLLRKSHSGEALDLNLELQNLIQITGPTVPLGSGVSIQGISIGDINLPITGL